MAKKQGTPSTSPAGKPRQVVFLTLDDETWRALESFRADQEVPPERAAVCVKALRQFLSDREYITPPKGRPAG